MAAAAALSSSESVRGELRPMEIRFGSDWMEFGFGFCL